MGFKKPIPITALIIMALLLYGCGGPIDEDKTKDSNKTNTSGETVIIDTNFTIIKSSLPEAGAKDATIDNSITIILDDRVDMTSFGKKNIAVLENGTVVNGVLLVNGQTVLFTPENPFAYKALVTVSLAGLTGVKGGMLTGITSFSFTTQPAPDEDAPYMISSLPNDGDTGVAINTIISVRVSEGLYDSEGVIASLTDESGNAITGKFVYDEGAMTFIFDPDEDLNYQTSYSFSLPNITDAAGNAADITISFTTSETPDILPPEPPSLALVTGSKATIEWIAPDDAASYILKRSAHPIETLDDFENAQTINIPSAPKTAGEAEEFIIPDVNVNEDLYVALRVFDEAANGSDTSSLHVETSPYKTYLVEDLADNATNDYFGFAVAGNCDINGDGFKDFVVSAPYDDVVVTDTGKVFVYFGQEFQAATNKVIIKGIDSHASTSTYDYFGYSVSCSHDFNGDGLDDILVGSPAEDTIDGSILAANSGAAYMFYGKDFDDDTALNAGDADIIFQGRLANDKFGNNVTGLGDINNDGFDDIAITSPWGEIVQTDEGVVYIYYGEDLQSDTVVYDINADVKIAGVSAGSSGGFYGTIKGGDIDGDGITDLALVAATYPTANRGSIYIWLGKNGLPSYVDLGTTPAAITITGTADTEYLGTFLAYHPSVSTNGDLNADGIDDLAIGAAYFDPSAGTNAGAVFVFFGRSQWNSTYSPVAADVIISGAAANDQTGSGVDIGGDYNKDGINDLLIGAAKFATGGGRGGAFIFYGSKEWETSANILNADVVISHGGLGYADIKLDNILHSDDLLGSALTSAGDTNGDGYDDILIGAYGNETGTMPTNSGAAYIIW